MKRSQFGKRTMLLEIALMIGLVLLESWGREASACTMSRDPKLNFFFSYETKTASFFDAMSNGFVPPSVVDRCQASAGKYLMFGLGVRYPKIASDIADISFDGIIRNDGCKVENSLIEDIQGYEERRKTFETQHKFLRKCVFLEVFDLGGKSMSFPEKQPACKMTATDRRSIQAEGDLCFLEIHGNNRFAINVVLRPECTQRDYLVSQGIAPQDVETVLNTYVAKEATGTSTDLTPIGSNRVRFVVTPGSELMELSEDRGPEIPRFPAIYAPEIHMGPVLIQQTNENRISTELFLQVDTRVPGLCKEGLCASPSDFSVPVSATVELYEMKENGKKQYVDEWLWFAAAPPNWQGLLRGPQHVTDEFPIQKGGRYQLDVTFIDPLEDYLLYLKGIEQMLIDLSQMNGMAGVDSFQSLNALSGIRSLPQLSGLPFITDNNLNAGINRALDALKKIGNAHDWPPYFEKVCSRKEKDCIPTGKGKFYLQLSSQFTVSEARQDGALGLSQINLTRKSPVLGRNSKNAEYIKNGTLLPSVACP